MRQPGEQCRLAQVELPGRLVEIEARRLANPIAPVPEIDVVQIDGEQLILAEVLLQPAGQDGLPDFAGKAALRREHHVLDDLLGNRRGALSQPHLLQVDDERAQDAEVVEPVVRVKIAVLGRDHGLAHDRGDLFEGNDAAALAEELGNLNAVLIEDLRHLRRVVIGHRLEARQIAAIGVEDCGHGHGADRDKSGESEGQPTDPATRLPRSGPAPMARTLRRPL